ncbi:hypothetical protein VTJ04DRAFT_9953 [Mycothermus thermophilus]|uniref:uncharacterized protein n=1 Tax=Humicola insolens TaxID=85995 RepID=UPI003742EAD3
MVYLCLMVKKACLSSQSPSSIHHSSSSIEDAVGQATVGSRLPSIYSPGHQMQTVYLSQLRPSGDTQSPQKNRRKQTPENPVAKPKEKRVK